MAKGKANDQQQALKKIQELVEAFEADGTPAKERNAREALEQLRNELEAETFPTAPTPIGVDLWRDYELHTELATDLTLVGELLALHAAALESYPALAELLRGALVAARVREAGEITATRLAREPREYASELLHHYRSELARQLAERGEAVPASELLGVTLPELETRLAAARERRDSAAARARADREKAELEELAQWFDARAGQSFVAGKWSATGGVIAAELRRGAAPVEAWRRVRESHLQGEGAGLR